MFVESNTLWKETELWQVLAWPMRANPWKEFGRLGSLCSVFSVNVHLFIFTHSEFYFLLWRFMQESSIIVSSF